MYFVSVTTFGMSFEFQIAVLPIYSVLLSDCVLCYAVLEFCSTGHISRI